MVGVGISQQSMDYALNVVGVHLIVKLLVREAVLDEGGHISQPTDYVGGVGDF
jgi:hypothetical protein